ncbi:MAG TPA: cell envelope integrity protein TolA, partial [Dokdonella sp.]
MESFADKARAFGFALGLHLLVIGALLIGLWWTNESKPVVMPGPVIDAVLIGPTSAPKNRASAAKPTPSKPTPEPPKPEPPQPQPAPEPPKPEPPAPKPQKETPAEVQKQDQIDQQKIAALAEQKAEEQQKEQEEKQKQRQVLLEEEEKQKKLKEEQQKQLADLKKQRLDAE